MPRMNSEFQNADFPSPANKEMLELGFSRWCDYASEYDHNQISESVETLTDNQAVKCFLSAIYGNSPYLTRICHADPGFVLELIQNGPTETVNTIINDIQCIDITEQSQSDLMLQLRRGKQRIALAIAAADMANIWTLQKITLSLSQFADAALHATVSFILHHAAQKGFIKLKYPDDPAKDSGFIVLGMGKLGAYELNYSSDIDLIVLFDPDKFMLDDPTLLQKYCVRMTRELVRIIEERTPAGYVFRTDLRLRPDPGATPLAVSLPAAEVYYESQGQNWERAAMIKARAVAGDIDAGSAFLKWLTPFIWRKNLDFAAIRDIHSIKRQINTHRGGRKIAMEGHNIKLGRGGIREIEFFVQTQQLIWGGRQTPLRTSSTIGALNELVGLGHVDRATADQMTSSYIFLRRCEHRLQMLNDEQTQTLPQQTDDMASLGIFMGFSGRDDFAADLLGHLRCVEDHYADLFEEAPALSAEGSISGNLVFTGSDSDPDTLETIAKLGFQPPETVDTAIRGWHHGRYRAMRSTRAREMLTELTPGLLKALAKTADPNATFLKFDEFLAGLPAGVQLFSMLHSNPQLLGLLASIMGEAPRLAEMLSRRPSLFDGVLVSDFLDPPLPLSDQYNHFSDTLKTAEHFEVALDLSRRWTNERKFQIGLQNMLGKLSPPKAARALSHVAEAVLGGMLNVVEHEFAQIHGRIPDSQFCTIALGKLGGHEMTPTSDLDLVFIYQTQHDEVSSDGPKPLGPVQYFARLGQRFINALTAPTAEGSLYEVDMRLRPSGNSGPIACSLEAFILYHEENAWTWERMALTRARTITGNEQFRLHVKQTVSMLLSNKSDQTVLLKDVASMRQRIDREHHTEQLWSIKHLRGGLVDVEFITQYLLLRHLHETPDLLSPNTWRAMKNLNQHGYLSNDDLMVLLRALDLWQALQSRLHLSLTSDTPPSDTRSMPLALETRLIRLGGARNLHEIETLISNTARKVSELFNKIIGEPRTDDE